MRIAPVQVTNSSWASGVSRRRRAGGRRVCKPRGSPKNWDRLGGRRRPSSNVNLEHTLPPRGQHGSSCSNDGLWSGTTRVESTPTRSTMRGETTSVPTSCAAIPKPSRAKALDNERVSRAPLIALKTAEKKHANCHGPACIQFSMRFRWYTFRRRHSQTHA